MRKLLLIPLAIIIMLAVTTIASRPVQAAYNPFGQACTTNGGKGSVCQETGKPQNENGNNSIYGPGGILAKAITILDIIIGVAAVVMIIIGGFTMILSSGDSNNVNSARNTILYAIVGLVIAISGQLIVTFVLNRL